MTREEFYRLLLKYYGARWNDAHDFMQPILAEFDRLTNLVKLQDTTSHLVTDLLMHSADGEVLDPPESIDIGENVVK